MMAVGTLSPLQRLFRSDTESLPGAVPRGLAAYSESYPEPLVLAGMSCWSVAGTRQSTPPLHGRRPLSPAASADPDASVLLRCGVADCHKPILQGGMRYYHDCGHVACPRHPVGVRAAGDDTAVCPVCGTAGVAVVLAGFRVAGAESVEAVAESLIRRHSEIMDWICGPGHGQAPLTTEEVCTALTPQDDSAALAYAARIGSLLAASPAGAKRGRSAEPRDGSP